MKRLGHPLFSLAAPSLIFLAMLSLTHREGSDRLQSIPSFVVGSGLIVNGAVSRALRRKKLLMAIRSTEKEFKDL